jgi:hypothetical protein
MQEKTATEICRQFYLSDTAKKLLTAELTTEQFLRVLIENKQYVDAVRLLAYSLPPKQAIGWATLCAREFARANPSDESRDAFEVIDQWVSDQTDENRRQAMKAAERAEFGTPAGSAALAIFFSGGSITPPDAPFIAPDESMMANSVFNAVILSVLSKEPEKSEDKYKLFLAEGQKLAASDQS